MKIKFEDVLNAVAGIIRAINQQTARRTEDAALRVSRDRSRSEEIRGRAKEIYTDLHEQRVNQDE